MLFYTYPHKLNMGNNQQCSMLIKEFEQPLQLNLSNFFCGIQTMEWSEKITRVSKHAKF